MPTLTGPRPSRRRREAAVRRSGAAVVGGAVTVVADVLGTGLVVAVGAGTVVVGGVALTVTESSRSAEAAMLPMATTATMPAVARNTVFRRRRPPDGREGIWGVGSGAAVAMVSPSGRVVARDDL